MSDSSRLEALENKLEEVRRTQAHWGPMSAEFYVTIKKRLVTFRRRKEYSSHPVVRDQIDYFQKSIRSIEFSLINDKQLPQDERRILQEKRGMYIAMLALISPNENVLSEIENELKSTDANSYQHTASQYGV